MIKKFIDFLNENIPSNDDDLIGNSVTTNTTDNNLNGLFQNWFYGSKVVNSKNNPLVVYHGSESDIDVYDEGYVFFTDDYQIADGYACGEYVNEVYLSIKNPLIIECHDKKQDDLDTPYGKSTQQIVQNTNTNKYDGVIFLNIKDSWIDDVDYQDASNVYVTFKPNQIKSIDNDGTQDIHDNNIYS